MDAQVLWELLLLALGLAALFLGARWLVDGAVEVSSFLGISPLVIGLTVVAFGTSAPELAVGVMAGLRGGSEIALGNVLGSNIFNVLFVLGVCALISPLKVEQQLVRLDVPIMVGTSLLSLILALDGSLDRFDGILMLLCFALYLLFTVRESKREEPLEEYDREFGVSAKGAIRLIRCVLKVLAGLGLLYLGSDWLVEGASSLARRLGVSEAIVGLTVVACGTSLPEVATSVLASLKGERNIAVGNVVGSNIFNLLVVLSGSALASGTMVVEGDLLRFDFPVMLAVAFSCMPVFFTGLSISRWEGFLFLGYYGLYLAYLYSRSSSPSLERALEQASISFILPLTVITLSILVVKELRERR